ncbi:hypothetical protein L207DRAFT_524149 [Hyaloscypha variabilis F]|uniref:Uncharacterized protein n=1 Tax=Hyaloscypha variabilis (strain UAMH 11265 / GT02V1 / F) TaxID=1149755 RepID=A0A2J6S7R3_HYAVF|nr:hypothetical protein L207DRAFT_524149 [Hyaloscypha variabilis F]
MARLTLFILLLPFTAALPNITAIPLGLNTCSGYPSSFPTNGANADAFIFLPTLVDNPLLNNLPTYITSNTLVVALTNTTSPSVFCCDHGGAVLSALGDQTLLFPAGSRMMELEYLTSGVEGVQPETYVHEIGGVRQEGTFLGRANVTTWAFGRLADEGSWRVRLMGSGAEELQDGEVEGFLRVVAP